ncbi:MAG: SpoIVB peptidase [Lachnospiraceae bacterium]|nr:SpoIVB peptidase [Lachnospiraceae bacterium]
MNRKKWYRRILCMVLFVSLIYTGYYAYHSIERNMPEKIHVISSEDIEAVDFDFPGCTNEMTRNEFGEYSISMKLFGILPIKDIAIEVIDESQVLICGFPVGIYIETEGVLVVGTADIETKNGTMAKPAYSILQPGDYLLEANGEKLDEKEELIDIIEESNGDEMILTIKRNDVVSKVKVSPVMASDGEYKLGIWVKDDAQGIGTLTYITSNGSFGALGHGVSDVDTGCLMESNGGSLYEAEIITVIKGESGTPGGLSGIIRYSEESKLGTIKENEAQGIFGACDSALMEKGYGEVMDIALKQDIKKGEAYIRCAVDGEIKDYEIEITKVNAGASGTKANRGLEIKVVDEELLSITNGIVQGMSGSPIIQNGKLIGAVTHVLVNDPARGYGIFIEEMLEH